MAWLHDDLQKLFAPDYLDDLDDRSLDQLRSMRSECDRAETAVSYIRRVVQVRLDLVQGILAGAGSGESDLSRVVEELPAIIGSGPPRPSGPGRLPVRLAPDMEDFEGEDLTADVDEVLDPGRIVELTSMSPAELRAISEQLVELESRISSQRRGLHERIDALQAEIVNRYKSGDATPDGLLT